MNTKEIWKDIPNYEGHYQVSNLGNVRSLERQIKTNLGIIHIIRDRILKGALTSNGYINVILQKNCHKKGRSVHSLVAECFLGHTPCGHDIVVDHIDNNPLNNKLDNLQLITNRYNLSRSKRNKTSKYTGVCWNKSQNKWRSTIYFNGKQEHLGFFNCELAAAKSYQDKLNSL